MLNITSRYAYTCKWRFSVKSVVMVFGESSSSWRKNRVDRIWHLSGSCRSEVDQTKHLGILISVFGSSLSHISRSISLARSSFLHFSQFALDLAVYIPTPHFDYLNPFLQPSFQYGIEVIYPTQTELLILERGQLTMLQIVPVRAPSIAIHFLLVLFLLHLSFGESTFPFLSLPDSAILKQVFLSRYHSPSTKGFSSHIKSIPLSNLDLPSVPELLEAFPTKIARKAHVKSILYITFYEQF